MSRKITELAISLAVAALMLVFAWFCLANVVFRLRHPWATETETLLNIRKAMMFKKVSYQEMRPRE